MIVACALLRHPLKSRLPTTVCFKVERVALIGINRMQPRIASFTLEGNFRPVLRSGVDRIINDVI